MNLYLCASSLGVDLVLHALKLALSLFLIKWPLKQFLLLTAVERHQIIRWNTAAASGKVHVFTEHLIVEVKEFLQGRLSMTVSKRLCRQNRVLWVPLYATCLSLTQVSVTTKANRRHSGAWLDASVWGSTVVCSSVQFHWRPASQRLLQRRSSWRGTRPCLPEVTGDLVSFGSRGWHWLV